MVKLLAGFASIRWPLGTSGLWPRAISSSSDSADTFWTRVATTRAAAGRSCADPTGRLRRFFTQAAMQRSLVAASWVPWGQALVLYDAELRRLLWV